MVPGILENNHLKTVILFLKIGEEVIDIAIGVKEEFYSF
jgi:hypothetical protein